MSQAALLATENRRRNLAIPRQEGAAMTTPDTVDGTEWADLSDEQREIFLAAMKRSGLDTETLTKPKPESETESGA